MNVVLSRCTFSIWWQLFLRSHYSFESLCVFHLRCILFAKICNKISVLLSKQPMGYSILFLVNLNSYIYFFDRPSNLLTANGMGVLIHPPYCKFILRKTANALHITLDLVTKLLMALFSTILI